MLHEKGKLNFSITYTYFKSFIPKTYEPGLSPWCYISVCVLILPNSIIKRYFSEKANT